ncbi:adenosylhomocysteine nucleosidase [Marisediminitalea aggregata]|jgi:adenosylhomocysteine nucleosidase|uniref:5'-methylthioadenosine/S-adenosylhomocysteine nucleosidase n=1 Tax=Marisediminitalea aggregata TaxID=634436 RepID=A0A1M5M0F2_9ALTE|nr:5'-methylthioadenosine/adenosylhomocysteine nucleosidase [Marisediminitalea aggregata]MAP23020.1 5'-methylthioadenosine/adenosylhomocysteine nucleosidase [Alteromonadaceae bacterium]MCP3862377.1 5'-methylthioadenosine/adenosylhomocysteine nucleosidase [Aestuariibacter sp.]MEC7471318.1 5'-methylthioadenosine/adenosylhomocysteine nucleosidase [Pseudomonadota bacterium]HBY40382.1 5'-methylthioadenosine/adenosylhomocysteine nucleosidase [Alteromonas sp.]MBL52528.1 5'-methylthioadenosine/adenosy|tara:strand:+ start:1059 stop:1763 length:705 start_codon:yes stop_codon:yes gene_type:complete
MKIGILGAMDQEVALLQASLDNPEVVEWKHLTFYTGSLHGVEVVVVKCGIGKVAAAVATTALVDRFAPDYVVNTGSAGGFDTDLNIGDLVIATSVLHHDIDITHFGYTLGQAAGMPATYESDETLILAAEQAAEQSLDVTTKRGLICTGDSFIGSDEAAARLREAFPTMAAVEMEGAAIAQTCFMLSTPFLVIRSLSDIAGKTSTVSFQSYLEKAAKHSAELVMQMIAVLAKQD